MGSMFARAFTIVRGVVYSAGFVWLWTWIAVSLRPFDAKIPVTLPDWLRPAGFGLALAGALLTGTCIATFVTKGRGTPMPLDPPRVFVATGPYRYVRNPMYVGAVMVIVGCGLIWSSPSVVLLGFAFLLLMHLLVVLYEEPALADQFGRAYEEYQQSVSRWRIRMPGEGD